MSAQSTMGWSSFAGFGVAGTDVQEADFLIAASRVAPLSENANTENAAYSSFAALPYSTTAAVNIQGITAEILEPSKLQLDFDKLSKEWYEETGGYSLTMRRYAHSSYQSILALEPKRDVIALILQELQHRPDRWFEALKALTKTNPAQDSKSFNETVQCWIKWGKSENYI